MDTFAKKTMRGMSSLADTLHLPDSWRCCGVGTLEAQIAAGFDEDDGSTSDDSVFAISKKDGQGNRETCSRSNTQSQVSQASGRSFLSGGFKMLASTSKSIFNSLRVPSPLPMDKRSPETSSDMTSMSDTDSSDAGEPARGVLLWRHVRMVVTGVRGMQGVPGESFRLERTVTYRAARRIQGVFRRKLACKAVIERRSVALTALKRAEELRRQRRRREADARKKYKEACRAEGKRVLEWAVKVSLQPRAIIDLQRVWRGYRARKRLAAYLKWLEDKARRRREYQRYLAALAATRGAGGRHSEQVKRRVWGRVEFTHTGWRPRYEVENPPHMHDHVWIPPRGSSSGVRTLKVLLPPPSERDRVTLVEDKNAWAGVPVGIKERKPPPERIGPPPRPGTITGADRNRNGQHLQAPSFAGGDGGFVTKYNWIPAPLVGKTPLLQSPSTASGRDGS
eukprot:g5427.t1